MTNQHSKQRLNQYWGLLAAIVAKTPPSKPSPTGRTARK